MKKLFLTVASAISLSVAFAYTFPSDNSISFTSFSQEEPDTITPDTIVKKVIDDPVDVPDSVNLSQVLAMLSDPDTTDVDVDTLKSGGVFALELNSDSILPDTVRVDTVSSVAFAWLGNF